MAPCFAFWSANRQVLESLDLAGFDHPDRNAIEFVGDGLTYGFLGSSLGETAFAAICFVVA